MDFLTQGLMRHGHEVKVLAVSSDKHPIRYDEMDAGYRKQTGIEGIHIDLSPKPLNAAVALLTGDSYNVSRYVNRAFATRLAEILDEKTFDVVHVDSIYLAPYVPVIRQHSNAPIVMRAHNVEHMLWRQIAQTSHGGLRRWYMKHLALTLRAYETEHVNDFDGVACISDDDAEIFRSSGCRRPIATVPFGVDLPTTGSTEEQHGTLFHIGAMDWRPNIEGVNWFLDKVWPAVHTDMPQLRLCLAGRCMPSELLEKRTEGVEVLGEVPDATEFMAAHQISVVPLLAGSGMRVKIAEAMALGKVVITTTVGASGMHYENDRNILIADTADEFARQIRRCMENDDLCRRIGNEARRLIEKEYTVDVAIGRLEELYNKVIEAKQ